MSRKWVRVEAGYYRAEIHGTVAAVARNEGGWWWVQVNGHRAQLSTLVNAKLHAERLAARYCSACGYLRPEGQLTGAHLVRESSVERMCYGKESAK